MKINNVTNLTEKAAHGFSCSFLKLISISNISEVCITAIQKKLMVSEHIRK